MIPKIMHYCWFGGKPYPKKVEECIASWRALLPDYDIKLWNEDSFDVSKACKFVKEAYEHGKYAFVSDYVRLHALYEMGGVYLDTDVEVVKPFTSAMLHVPLGIALDEAGYVAVVMFAQPGNAVIKRLMEKYEAMDFVRPDGSLNMEVNNTYIQEALAPLGYVRENKLQHLASGIVLYPDDYFQCRSLTSGKLHLTPNTCTIHWHTILWASRKTKLINWVRIHILVPLLGSSLYTKLTTKIKGDGKTTI